MPLPQDLDDKYSKMWHESCDWRIPDNIEPFRSNGSLANREQRLYAEACWHVLNMMAEDGLLRRSTLRRLHDEENGWEPGRSTIEVGAK